MSEGDVIKETVLKYHNRTSFTLHVSYSFRMNWQKMVNIKFILQNSFHINAGFPYMYINYFYREFCIPIPLKLVVNCDNQKIRIVCSNSTLNFFNGGTWWLLKQM